MVFVYLFELCYKFFFVCVTTQMVTAALLLFEAKYIITISIFYFLCPNLEIYTITEINKIGPIFVVRDPEKEIYSSKW